MSLFSLIKWIMLHPLNRRAPLGRIKALRRFLTWQLASRLIPARVALPYVNSTYLLTERGMTGASGNWYCGLHEPSEMGFVLHGLRREDLFVDVGANIGSYSILTAGAVGATVIAVEPIPQTFSRLRANVSLNDLTDRIELHNIGLSNQEGVLSFTKSFDTMNRVMLPSEDLERVEVPVRTLDHVLDGRVPAVIKIDVEGHELLVLRGASTTLQRAQLRAVIMETNSSGKKYGISDYDLIEEMRRYGFVPYTYDPLRRELSPTPPGASNSIFLRDSALLTALCKSAATYNLLNGPI